MRRAGAGLVRIDDELVAMLAAKHFVGRLHDRVGALSVESSRFLVRQRRGLLDPHLGIDERIERTEAADRKVLLRAQCLHAISRVGGDVERTERILLATSFAHEFTVR